MNSFDFSRVRSLFLYDWMLEKRRIGLSALIVLGLYIVIAWFIWSVYRTSWMDEERVGYYLPTILLRGYCSTFFILLAVCSVFFVTPVLQRKFAKPQTATAYLTLPGTTAEKYWVMLVEYLLGFVACFVFYIVCFYGTALIGSLFNHPTSLVTWWAGDKPLNAYGWFDYSPVYFESLPKAWNVMWNMPFADSSVEEAKNAYVTMVRTGICMIPVVMLLQLGYYLVLNMLFRTYGQIKSILCHLGTQMALNMIVSIVSLAFIGYVDSLDNVDTDQLVINGMYAATGLMWVSPLLMVGMYYLLYRLMAHKQAK